MKEERRSLIDYRLEQADESLESARILWEHKKYRPSVSRSYYAMFYAVQALLTRKELITSKHSGAIAVFNREFVKKKLVDKEFSRWLQEAKRSDSCALLPLLYLFPLSSDLCLPR